MNNQNSTHQLFVSWGSKERHMPPHHEQLKNSILVKFESVREEPSCEARHLPWASFAFSALAVAVLVINVTGVERATPPMSTASSPSSGTGVSGGESLSAPSAKQETAPDYYPYPLSSGTSAIRDKSLMLPSVENVAPDYYPYPVPGGSTPITDTREFLKTDYHAVIRTRHVEDLTRRVETTVRGFGGRVDSTSRSPRFGFVSFAIPANKLDIFKDEIEGLVGSRFLSVNMQTQNLLSQKQSIEQQQKQIQELLSRLRSDRQKLVAGHNSSVATMQTRLSVIASELALLRAEQTNDPVRKAEIAKRIGELTSEQGVLSTQLINENAFYSQQLNSADRKIREAETNSNLVKTEDQNLIDNVATVQGSISINWISIGEIVQLYVSLYWIVLGLAVAAVISYFLDRRRVRSVLL